MADDSNRTRFSLADWFGSAAEDSGDSPPPVLRAMLHQLFASVPVGLFVLDNDTGRFLVTNRELQRILGYGAEELAAMSFERVVAPEDIDRVREYRRRRMRNDATLPRQYEMLLAHRSGERRAVVFHANPLALEDVITGAIVDVTSEKLRHDPMLHLQRLDGLATLASGMASEFNNLLTAISGFAELGLATVPQDSRAGQSFERIMGATAQALGHVKGLLSFARSGSNALERVDVAQLATEVASLAPQASAGGRPDIDLKLPTDSAITRGDFGQLEQATINVLLNAIEALPSHGGRVGLTVTLPTLPLGNQEGLPAGNYIALTIEDNGDGIPLDQQSLVFQPFFTTRTASGHTGLGLSAALGIAQEHGGTIALESTLARGTSVTLLLPREAEQDDLLPATMLPLPPAPSGPPPTILVVDDQEYVLELFGELLQTFGYRPRCFESAELALAALGDDPDGIDAIIVDLLMPGMDGRTFIRRVREAGLSHPIIVSSGYSSAEEGDAELRTMTSAFLRKPFAPEELERQLAMTLQVDDAEPGGDR